MLLLQTVKKRLLSVISALFTLIVALFWLALRVNWAGISKALGADKNPSFLVMQLPLLVCIATWIVFAFAFVTMLVASDKKWTWVTSFALGGVFAVVCGVVVALGACDYIQFILPRFFLSLLGAFAVIVFALLLFFPNKCNCKKCLALKIVCVSLALVLAILGGYGIVFVNRYTYKPVVYAVGDEYQIVFSTSAQSIAWVTIDGENFYDLYAGSMKSNDTVHKVCVPQSKLDNAKGYTINAQKMIYRGPFGGYKGDVISESYNFTPVDLSDGLVYYSMSDVHSARKGAVATAKSVQNLDFLILLGDMYSMIDSEYDAQFANLVAFDVTGGQKPVVYTRGNHEIKGRYAEDLHKYVGSDNGNFFYEYTLGGVYGIVLDLGEDHDDDWWEYYQTAQFTIYQQQQTEMLQDIVANNRHLGHDYTVVSCHIPVQFVNSRHNHTTVKAQWTTLLNQIQPDLFVSGHQHDLYPFLLADKANVKYNENGKLVYNTQFVGRDDKTYGGYLTDYQFNGFIVGKRGSTQKDSAPTGNKTEHIGLATYVDFASGTQKSVYLNSKGNAVDVFVPFADGESKREFVTNLLAPSAN